MRIEVEGEPVAKQRPRFTRQGGFVRTYTPKKTLDYEKAIAEEFLKQEDRSEYEGYVRIKCIFYMPMPKAFSKKKREKALKGDILPITKKDVDNLVKSVLDGLNGVAYKDDKQVVSLYAHKYYSDRPRTEVVIEYS